MAGRLATQLQLLSGFSATYVVELGGEGSGWRLDFFALGAVLLATLVLCLGAKEYSYLVSGAAGSMGSMGRAKGGARAPAPAPCRTVLCCAGSGV